jgi:hypothetical protein
MSATPKKMTKPQQYLTLAPKTTAVVGGSPFAVILLWLLSEYASVDPPDYVQVAIGSAILTLFSYFAPSTPQALVDAKEDAKKD